MGLVTKPYDFTSGTTIVANEHDANFDTLYTLVNGNIENANIKSSAAIAYSKLNLATSILNSDISTTASIAASKLNLASPGNIGGTTPQDGTFLDLTCSSLFVGSSAINEISDDTTLSSNSSLAVPTVYAVKTYIDTNASKSNVLFSFALGGADHVADTNGAILNDSIVGALANITPLYWSVDDDGSGYQTVLSTKFIKTSGVSTVTIYVRMWQNEDTSNSNQANCKVIIGSVSGEVAGTAGRKTGEWKNFDIDVSSLTNGTFYDVSIQLKASRNDTTDTVYMDSIIAFGS